MMRPSPTVPDSDSPLAPESSVPSLRQSISAPPIKKSLVVTRANAKQIAVLKRAFAASNTVRSDEIVSLCEQTSLPEKWIYAWFGRQRAKARRAGDLDAGTARSSDPVLSMSEIMNVKTEHRDSLLIDVSSSVEPVPPPKRKRRGRRPRLKAEFNDSVSVAQDVQETLPSGSGGSRPVLLPLFIPQRSSLAPEINMNTATSVPSTPLLYMRIPAPASSRAHEASSRTGVDDPTRLHVSFIPQRSVFVSPIGMDTTTPLSSVPSTIEAVPVLYTRGPQSWNGHSSRIYSPSEPVQDLMSSISRRKSQVQVNHEFQSQNSTQDFQQNNANAQIDFQFAQIPSQIEVQSQPRANTGVSLEQSPPFHTRFRNQGPSDYGSKSPQPLQTSSARSIDPINAYTGFSFSPFLSSASGAAVPLHIVEARGSLAAPFSQHTPPSWHPLVENGTRAKQTYYHPPENLRLNTVHPVPASGQNEEVMETRDIPNNESCNASSPERVDASFAWDIMPPGSASLPDTRRLTPPPELLYPFKSLEMDTSVAIDMSNAPVKHIEDLLKPFFVGEYRLDGAEVTVVKSDGLVNALLDEELVHKDPFKAAMSLVFASQLGLQWDYHNSV